MNKKKQYTLSAVILLSIIIFSMFHILRTTEKKMPISPITPTPSMVSKEIYRGKGYELNLNQEKEIKKHREKQKREWKEKEESHEEAKGDFSLVSNKKEKTFNSESLPGKNKDKTFDSGNENEGNTEIETSEKENNVSKKPLIETELINGMISPDCFLPFSVRATDYRGRLIGGNNGYLKVTVNGETDNGAQIYDIYGSPDGRTYQVDLNEGSNWIIIYAEDSEGNASKKAFSVIGSMDAEVPDYLKARLKITLDLSNLGIERKFGTSLVTVRQDETAVRAVEKYLALQGIEYSIQGDRYGSYLKGMGCKDFIKGCHYTEKQVENILNDTSLTNGKVLSDGTLIPPSYDWLSEKDITGGSGWMWKYNGQVLGWGISNQTVNDGDEIRIFWTNNLGWDSNGGWDSSLEIS